jgi:hypothetical protein
VQLPVPGMFSERDEVIFFTLHEGVPVPVRYRIGLVVSAPGSGFESGIFHSAFEYGGAEVAVKKYRRRIKES